MCEMNCSLFVALTRERERVWFTETTETFFTLKHQQHIRHVKILFQCAVWVIKIRVLNACPLFDSFLPSFPSCVFSQKSIVYPDTPPQVFIGA